VIQLHSINATNSNSQQMSFSSLIVLYNIYACPAKVLKTSKIFRITIKQCYMT